MRTCEIEGCDNKQIYRNRGLCKKCYNKQYYQDTKIVRNGKEKSKFCLTCKTPIYYKAIYCNKCKQLGKKNHFYGMHHSNETREKMQGENSGNWKGGITPLYEAIRCCFEYRQWRSDIFTRDNFTCQKCGDAIGGNLVAHHIVEFADIIERYEITTLEEALKCEELWNINNGQTLCDDCHIEEHNERQISLLKQRQKQT